MHTYIHVLIITSRHLFMIYSCIYYTRTAIREGTNGVSTNSNRNDNTNNHNSTTTTDNNNNYYYYDSNNDNNGITADFMCLLTEGLFGYSR